MLSQHLLDSVIHSYSGSAGTTFKAYFDDASIEGDCRVVWVHLPKISDKYAGSPFQASTSSYTNQSNSVR
jgi:hypothetical protein